MKSWEPQLKLQKPKCKTKPTHNLALVANAITV